MTLSAGGWDFAPARRGTNMSENANDRDRRSGTAARKERLAQALRDNLKRRKAQIRGRAADAKPASDRTKD